MLVLLPVIARAGLGGNLAYSLLLAMLGTGALAGAVLASRWQPRRPGLVALLALLPGAGALLSLAQPLSLALACPLFVVAAIGTEVFQILFDTSLQREFPPDQLGRTLIVAASSLLPLTVPGAMEFATAPL